MTQKLLNQEMLDSYRELQTLEDPNFFKNYLTVFLDPIPAHLEAIRLAILNKETQKLTQSAHAIKSSCANVGATLIMDPCAQLEKLGRQGTVDGAQELYLKVVKLCELLKLEVHSLPEFKV